MKHRHIIFYLVFVYGLVMLPLITVSLYRAISCPVGTISKVVSFFDAECVPQ